MTLYASFNYSPWYFKCFLPTREQWIIFQFNYLRAKLLNLKLYFLSLDIAQKMSLKGIYSVCFQHSFVLNAQLSLVTNRSLDIKKLHHIPKHV